MSKYDTAGQKIHLEYRVYMDTLFRSAARPIRYQKQPAPSFTRQIDILRSDTGDVWEIEPIAKRKDAVPQATRNMNLLRYWGIEAQNPVLYCDDCGLYDYNWNRVEWRLGINFPILRIEDWEDTPLGHTTVLVAASPEAGSILYWLELNDKVKADAAALAAIAAAAGLFGELGKGGVPRRKRPPVPAFELLCLGFLYVYSSLPVEPDVTPYLPDPLPSYPQFPGTSPAPPRLDPRAYVA